MGKKTARAIIVEDKGLMVLYRERINNGNKIHYYAIPGGHVEKNETLEETLKRELKEELNIDVQIIKYLGVMDEGSSENYYYECKRVGGEPVLGGEELDRNCLENYYEFRYLPISSIKDANLRADKFVWMVIGD